MIKFDFRYIKTYSNDRFKKKIWLEGSGKFKDTERAIEGNSESNRVFATYSTDHN